MTIFEIDRELEALIDTETGELKDYEAYEALSLEREAKIENTACWIIELDAEAAAIREQEKVLAGRRKAAENKAERLREYLDKVLSGQSYSSARCAVSYRTSRFLSVDDEEALIEELQRRDMDALIGYVAPKPDKRAITQAIRDGESFESCRIEEKKIMTIK